MSRSHSAVSCVIGGFFDDECFRFTLGVQSGDLEFRCRRVQFWTDGVEFRFEFRKNGGAVARLPSSFAKRAQYVCVFRNSRIMDENVLRRVSEVPTTD